MGIDLRAGNVFAPRAGQNVPQQFVARQTGPKLAHENVLQPMRLVEKLVGERRGVVLAWPKQIDPLLMVAAEPQGS